MTDKPRFEGERVKLGDVCTIVSGATPKTKTGEYWDGEIKWVTPAELDSDSHYISDTEKHLTEAGYKSASLHMMPKGTVLLTTRAPIGKVAIAAEEMSCNQGFKNLVCSSAINNEFLYLCLKSRTAELQAMGRGATFKELSKKNVAGFEINLPAIDRQLDAVAKLTAVGNQIARAKQQHDQLDTLVKSRFVEMFGDSDSSAFDTVLVEDVCTDVVDCPHQTPKYQGKLTHPAIRTSELVGTTIDWSTMRYVSEEEYSRRVKRLKPRTGDVVYAREGVYGTAAILPEGYQFCLGQRTMLYRPNGELCTSSYLLYSLTSDDVKKQADMLNIGSTVPHVNVKDAKRFKIMLPPLELQHQFADFVAQVDKSRFIAQQQIEKLQMLYDSLAQEYFA